MHRGAWRAHKESVTTERLTCFCLRQLLTKSNPSSGMIDAGRFLTQSSKLSALVDVPYSVLLPHSGLILYVVTA